MRSLKDRVAALEKRLDSTWVEDHLRTIQNDLTRLWKEKERMASDIRQTLSIDPEQVRLSIYNMTQRIVELERFERDQKRKQKTK